MFFKNHTSFCARFAIALVLLVVMGNLSISSAYTRGRVKVIENTPMTDQGTLLRGVSPLIWGPGRTGNTDSKSYYDGLKASKLNSIRLAVQFAPQWQTDTAIAPKIPLIDKALDVAESAGVYVGIDFHDCGHYEMQQCMAFWNICAPRYRMRTHVIYEIYNEASWASQDWGPAYRFVRALAPLTHIIIFSSGRAGAELTGSVPQIKGIDYSNTTVGYHPYFTSTTSFVQTLHKTYPCMTTEMTPYPGLHDWGDDMYLAGNRSDSLGWVRFHEKEKISWWLWGISPGAQMQPVFTYAERDGYTWQADNFTTPPTVPFGVNFAAGADTIWKGDSLVLQWECPHATSVSFDNGIGTVAASGYKVLIPAGTTTYTLTAQGPGGPITKSETVVVLPLREPENPPDALPGLNYTAYEGTWNAVPSFDALIPKKTGVCDSFDVQVGTRPDNVGIRFDGFIQIPKDGIYNLMISDMAAGKLYIGNTLINYNKIWEIGEHFGIIGLKAGKHAIRVDYCKQSNSGSFLTVKQNWQRVARANLFHTMPTAVIEDRPAEQRSALGFRTLSGILLTGGDAVSAQIFDARGREVKASKNIVGGSVDLRRLKSGCHIAVVQRNDGSRRTLMIAAP